MRHVERLRESFEVMVTIHVGSRDQIGVRRRSIPSPLHPLRTVRIRPEESSVQRLEPCSEIGWRQFAAARCGEKLSEFLPHLRFVVTGHERRILPEAVADRVDVW